MEEIKMDNGSITISLDLYNNLLITSERMRIIERFVRQQTYININDLLMIMDADPLPEEKKDLSFEEMLNDDPNTEESPCT